MKKLEKAMHTVELSTIVSTTATLGDGVYFDDVETFMEVWLFAGPQPMEWNGISRRSRVMMRQSQHQKKTA